MSTKILVTGMGAISPAGVGVRRLWQAARDGRALGDRIVAFDTSRNHSKIGAWLAHFEPRGVGLSHADLSKMDRCTQFSRVASTLAVLDAGLSIRDLNSDRCGVCIGTAIGGVGFMERVFGQVCRRNGNCKPRFVDVDPANVDPNLYGGFAAQSVSCEVAKAFGLQGVCTTMATGCTAGLDAIGAANDIIASGLADIMITGGVDAPITPVVFTAFDNIHCLTRRNDEPRTASRPFDRDRDGFLLSEGGGILVLESQAHAAARGASAYGELRGFASLSNAYHMTSLPADGAALARTIQRALDNAQVGADEVDYINAHGSSTPQNDRNETSAFKQVFGRRAYEIPISSTKSVIGHSLGAASALEAIVCLAALGEQVVPPTANYQVPDPTCDLDYVPNTAREARLKIIECNASGFSGIHSAAIFGLSNLTSKWSEPTTL